MIPTDHPCSIPLSLRSNEIASMARLMLPASMYPLKSILLFFFFFEKQNQYCEVPMRISKISRYIKVSKDSDNFDTLNYDAVDNLFYLWPPLATRRIPKSTPICLLLFYFFNKRRIRHLQKQATIQPKGYAKLWFLNQFPHPLFMSTKE